MYEYFDDLGGEALQHYGVLGMKWGVRRYQNYDGSLIHPKGGRKRGKTSFSKALDKYETKKDKKEQRQYNKFITSSKDDKKFRRAISRAADDWYSDDKRSRDEWEYPEAEGSKEKFIDAVAKNPNLYRGTHFMDAASTYYRDDKILNKIEKKEAKAKAIEERKKAEEQHRQEKFEKKKAKAIANVDIDSIIKMRGQLTTAELQDARTRALAIKQINDSRLPKPKSTVEKLVDKLDVGKKTLDSIKNFHASVRGLGEEIGVIEKKETSDQNQNGKKKKKDSTVPDKIGERLSDLEKRIGELKGQSKGEKQQSGEPKKKGGLDIWESEDSEWSSPSFAKRTRMSDVPKASQNRESLVSRLSRVGQVFSDTTPDQPTAREKNDSWISKLSSVSRDMSIERVKKRNESGWTAKNNDEWMSVLSDAANIHIGDGEWNKYYKYK